MHCHKASYLGSMLSGSKNPPKKSDFPTSTAKIIPVLNFIIQRFLGHIRITFVCITMYNHGKKGNTLNFQMHGIMELYDL